MTRAKKKKPGFKPKDGSTTDPKPAKAKAVKKKEKQAKKAETKKPIKRMSDFSKALAAAFADKRAIRFITPKHVPDAIVNNPDFRSYFFQQIANSPHTASAWTVEVGKDQLVSTDNRNYYVLAVYEDPEQAQNAKKAIHPATIEWQGQKVQVDCNGKPGMAFTELANLLQPDEAAPPITSGNQAPTSGNLIPDPNAMYNNSTIPPQGNDNAKQDPSQITQLAAELSLSLSAPEPILAESRQILHEAEQKTVDAKSLTKPPQQPFASAAVISPPLLSAQMEVTSMLSVENRRNITVDSTTTAAKKAVQNNTATNRDIKKLDATTLWGLSTADHEKLQRRYFGHVDENDGPCCVLCGSRNHVWNYCPELKCSHCGEIDTHVSSACPNVKKCSKCHEKGHDVESCPSKLKRTYEDGFSCDLCGKDGHSENECSYIWRQFIPEREGDLRKARRLNVWCYSCGSSSHWGGDCNKPSHRVKRPLFDTFSSREASKYEDPGAPLMSLGVSPKIGLQIKGIAAAPEFDLNSAGQFVREAILGRRKAAATPVAQPPRQQSRQQLPRHAKAPSGSQYVPASAPIVRPSQQLHYVPASIPTKPTSRPPSAHANAYPTSYSSLPVRPTSRGNDGYVQYQPQSHTQAPPDTWAPPPSSRRRSRSPQPRSTEYRTREDVNAGIYAEYPPARGYYDGGGTYSSTARSDGYGPSSSYRPVPPPPPPAPANYRHVPPPPPSPSRAGHNSRSRKGAQPPAPPRMGNYQPYR